MPELWIYVLGGIIIAVITLLTAYILISNSINHAEKQIALNEFSSLFTDVQTVCLGEVNNSIGPKKYSIPFIVRVIYTTNETNKILPKVVDLIKNQNKTSGFKFCLQFKDEDKPRCLPEYPEVMYCNTTMPYIGALPETEDIWMMVNKILGKPRIKEYYLTIQKIDSDKVKIEMG